MESFWEILKLIIYGVVEGITEWLPISSTGHLLLLEEFLPLQLSADFLSLFRIAIQLAAILAVIIYFWPQLWPLKTVGGIPPAHFQRPRQRSRYQPFLGRIFWDKQVLRTWLLVLLGCIPAALFGFFLDDFFEEHFYNPLSVALALIIVGILFILVENWQKNQQPEILSINYLTWQKALLIGCCQMLAGAFPGVSRSGACIIGGLVLGLSRPLASEYSFFMAVPVMLGASFLKLLRLSQIPSTYEWIALILASTVALLISLITIKFFMNYIKRHSFRPFAYYRIALGILVLLLFFL